MQCILFDLDGTIQDSEKLASAAHRFGFRAVLGRDATQEELERLVGKAVAKVLAEQFPGQGERIMEKIVEYYEARSHQIVCFGGVIELLHGLAQAGYELGIVSSKQRKNITRELGLHSILHVFRCIVGQEDTREHKPHPAPLLLAAELMGYKPEQCIYIGDQPTDIAAAAAAGMRSAAALWGEGKLERLAPCSPDFIFATPQSALEFFTEAAAQLKER